MSYSLLTVEIRFEQDLVLARQRARQIASLIGFDAQEQTRIATAVSEVARNALKYTGGGKVEFAVEERSPQVLLARIFNVGARIADLQAALDGRNGFHDEIGLGLVAARRLIDDVQIEPWRDRGTVVNLSKHFPKQSLPLSQLQLAHLVSNLARQTPENPFAEIQQQNQELLRTLAELRQRQEELAQLNQELEDTNRGVVALYAELSDKAESLQRASELKSRFFSNMSHEFRTPLNAIISLSEMLLARLDGELTQEQEKQVKFIHKSAESLSELVNDLLDLAKAEAGKLDVRVATFEVVDLFSALRGMLRPLLHQNCAVNLIFEEPEDPIALTTDEAKVSQILRNLISNALKYTECGEVRVSAKMGTNQIIIFSVTDTGIGIAPKDQKRIFEEYVQIENPLQRKVRGTGLGLPLCQRLTELLGGKIYLQSKLGVGSIFSVALPIAYSEESQERDAIAAQMSQSIFSDERDKPDSSRQSSSLLKILLIDDDEIDRYTIASWLSEIPCIAIEAVDGYEGLEQARTEQPQAILLDLLMPGITGFDVLERLKSDPATRDIPVIIITSKSLEPSEVERLSASAVAILSKQVESREQAIARLREALTKAGI
jgi:signal transduction histidine kinase/ActR/RegA family two-component response regulator